MRRFSAVLYKSYTISYTVYTMIKRKITTQFINRVVIVFFMVEIRRIELLTSCMPCKRSPS